MPASNNPEYSDHQTFSIFINGDVEKYLESDVSMLILLRFSVIVELCGIPD